MTGESLGQGSYGKVETCVNVFTGQEFAVKIIQKVAGLFNRSKVIFTTQRTDVNVIMLPPPICPTIFSFIVKTVTLNLILLNSAIKTTVGILLYKIPIYSYKSSPPL